MKSISIAVAAISTLVVAQPGFSAHRNAVHANTVSNNEGLELGNFFAFCCGGAGNTGSSQTLHVPKKGFGAQLQVTQPNCCDSTFVETGIENVNGTHLLKEIRFTVTGLDKDPPPTANFGVDVFWTTPHGSQQFGFFTVANGGLIQTGNQFRLRAGGHGITPGSTLNEVDFELDGNCVASKQTAFIQNVFIDNAFVAYELDGGLIEPESAFCGGCS